jgi:hypothetical protein
MSRTLGKNSSIASFRVDGVASSTAGVTLPSLSLGFRKNLPYTVACFFKIEQSTQSVDRSIFSNGNSASTNQCFNIKYTSSGALTDPKIGIFLRTDGATTLLNNVFSNTAFTRGSWVHLAWVDDGTGAPKLYLNGVLDSKSFAYTIGAATLTLDRTSFGSLYRTASASPMVGSLSDCRVYHRALSASEVLALSNGVSVDSTNLQLLWSGNNMSTAGVPDESGNGNNGTWQGVGSYVTDSPFYNQRRKVIENLVYNGDLEFVPKSSVANVPTTGSSRWVDGSASSASMDHQNPVGWGTSLSGTASVEFDENERRNGRATMKLSTLASGSYAEAKKWLGTGSFQKYAKTMIQIKPNTSYTYGFWMKTRYVSGDSFFGVNVQWQQFSIAGTNTTNTSTTYVKTTSDWTYYSGTITTGPSAFFLSPRLTNYGHSGSTADLIMDAWFDDITLVETTPVERSIVEKRLIVRDFGTALSFDGNDYVSITNPNVLDFTTQFTLACWFKTATIASTAGGELFILAKALPAGGTYKYALFAGNGNKLSFALYNGTSNPRVDDVTQLKVGEYTFATVTYDGANIKLYKNGVFVAQTATTLSLPTGTSNFEIGRRAGASDRNFKGIIDEPRSWNRALSSTEVSDLYYNGLTRDSALASGLVGEWLFDEGSGSIALDASGNGNNGTITGATYTFDVFCQPRLSE